MGQRTVCACAALAIATFAGETARADCSPASANNITAICSGTTTNQAGGAPGASAGVNGYGTGFETGLTVEVLTGATVTGTNWGIRFDSGTVTNYGIVSGAGSAGISGSATTYNFGTVTGFNGISGFDATVFNFGTITGTNFGITGTTVRVTNYGAITGVSRGVTGGDMTVVNHGTISSTNSYAVSSTGIATVTNYGTIVSASNNGINSTNSATIDNYGSITGTLYGIYGTNLVVNNAGTITGAGANGFSLNVNGVATVTNSGTLQGGILGTSVTLFNSGAVIGNSGGGFKSAVYVGTANVTNSGTISGVNYGIHATDGTVTNSGTIAGNTGIYFSGGTSAAVVNAGTITGTGGTAIDFSGSSGDSLTLLKGSRIVGAIKLGSGDNVTMTAGGDISSLTTFTPNGAYSLNVTGRAPYVVSGNQVAIVEPTSFAIADRAVMDMTRATSGLIDQRLGETAASDGAGTGATAYAAPDGVSTKFERVFAQFPGARMRRTDSYGVWAKGFAGRRIQGAHDDTLRAVSDYGGGVLGIDRRVSSNWRAGAFFGVGKTRTGIDSNSGGSDSNTVFAGFYGRWFGAASYIDVLLSGGVGHNAMTRTVANNLAANGLETASATSNDWYVNPELTYGLRYAFGRSWTLTPAVHLRYVVARLGGYTETGSLANMVVGGRTAQNVEERGDLTLTRAFELADHAQLHMSLRGGLLGLQRVGGTTVNAVLLGQGLTFATPGKSSVTGIYFGAGLNWRRTEQFSLFADAEYTTMSDSSSVLIAKGGLRAAFR